MRRALGVLGVCAVAWGIAYATWRTSPPSFDFIAIYASARLAAEGRIAEVTDRRAIAAMEHAILPERDVFLNNPNPPLVSLVLAPLGALPFELAYGLWLAVLVAAMCAAAFLLAPLAAPRQRTGLFLFALLAPPSLVALTEGQTTPLVLLAVAAALRAPPRWSGLLLAATALRPQFLPVFALIALADPHRRWPFVAGVAGAAAASLALVGFAGVPGYVDLVTSSAAELRPVDVGVASLARRFGVGEDALVSVVVAAAALLLAAVVLLRRLAERRLPDGGAWALFAAPHALLHDTVLAYPSVARRAGSARATGLWVLSGLVVFLVQQAGLPVASLWLAAIALSPSGER